MVDDDLRRLNKLKSLESLSLLQNVGITDAGIRHLEPLKTLKIIALVETTTTSKAIDTLVTFPELERLDWDRMTNDDLAKLKVLKKLEVLNCASHSSQITDDGLIHLEQLPRLRGVFFEYSTWITDRGAGILAEIPQLRTIDLQHTSVTEAGWQKLAQLPNLESVDTDLNSDAMIRIVAGIPTLQSLGSFAFRIDATRLALFKDHPSLRVVELRSPLIDDDCFAILLTLKKMKSLTLLGTKVTPVGIERFRELRPDVELTVDGKTHPVTPK